MPLVNAEVRCFRIRTEKQNKNKKERMRGATYQE